MQHSLQVIWKFDSVVLGEIGGWHGSTNASKLEYMEIRYMEGDVRYVFNLFIAFQALAKASSKKIVRTQFLSDPICLFI